MFALMEHSKKTEAKQAQDGLETLSKLQDGAEVFKPVGKMYVLDGCVSFFTLVVSV